MLIKPPPKFRPMKAAKVTHMDYLNTRLPLLATPKWDGIRAFTFAPIIQELFGKPCEIVSLSLEKIPNKFIQETLRSYGITGLDGELITYTDGKMDSYNTIQSKVMSHAGEPDFLYHVFDLVAPMSYWERMTDLKDNMDFPESSRLRKCLPVLLTTEDALLKYEERMLLEGYEGVMLRDPDGPYKFGRSTEKEGYLFKLKRFLDAEATVIDFEELMHNENEPTADNFGLTERSSHKANLMPGNTLGALVVVGHNQVRFKIGSGFDKATRDDVWQNRERYKFQTVKYKYQPHGVKDAPRCPIFLGFRPIQDIAKSI